MPELHHRSCQHNAYRLSCEDFEELWAYADGRCQLCGITADQSQGGRLEIDHSWLYGYFAVRGLLCGPCNRGLGRSERAQDFGRRTRAYLQDAWFVRVLKERHARNVRDRRAARRAS